MATHNMTMHQHIVATVTRPQAIKTNAYINSTTEMQSWFI